MNLVQIVREGQVERCEPNQSGDMAGSEEFLKGQLLLDSGQLGGSFFQRTVVLICQHDAEGAFGLVLNRATGSQVGEMIVADLPDSLKTAPLCSLAGRSNLRR